MKSKPRAIITAVYEMFGLVQFIKFSLVGVLNTGIHYAVFYYLYSYLEFYHLLASAIGFCFAVINSYLFNKYWTFNCRDCGDRYQFIRFSIVNLISLAINLGSMFMLVEWLFINPLSAQLVSIGFTLVVNFSGNKFWSFRKVQG